jgi:hypothetical protein
MEASASACSLFKLAFIKRVCPIAELAQAEKSCSKGLSVGRTLLSAAFDFDFDLLLKVICGLSGYETET